MIHSLKCIKDVIFHPLIMWSSFYIFYVFYDYMPSDKYNCLKNVINKNHIFDGWIKHDIYMNELNSGFNRPWPASGSLTRTRWRRTRRSSTESTSPRWAGCRVCCQLRDPATASTPGRRRRPRGASPSSLARSRGSRMTTLSWTRRWRRCSTALRIRREDISRRSVQADCVYLFN